jgi:hypothetical protein
MLAKLREVRKRDYAVFLTQINADFTRIYADFRGCGAVSPSPNLQISLLRFRLEVVES